MMFRPYQDRQLTCCQLISNNENSMLNVRGLGNPRAVRRLQHSLQSLSPWMVFFIKTKLDRRRMERVRRKCNFLFGLEVDVDRFHEACV